MRRTRHSPLRRGASRLLPARVPPEEGAQRGQADRGDEEDGERVAEVADRVLDDLCTVACTQHDAIIYIGNVSVSRLRPRRAHGQRGRAELRIDR